MRILFIGDIVAEPGRRVLRRGLRRLRREMDPDLVVVNGENAAGGNGLTPKLADEIFEAGTDVITSGNHIWDRRELPPVMDDMPRLLRPANYPEPAPGHGWCRVQGRDGTPATVINLMGRIFMAPIDDPFRAADRILERTADGGGVTLIDFHAETTSEKMALGWYLDGRVTAVIGTHTHVPTADARVLPGGTAFISDVGMTGPYASVIGVEHEIVVQRFLTQRPVRMTPATEDVRLCGVTIEADPHSGKALSIERVEISEEESG